MSYSMRWSEELGANHETQKQIKQPTNIMFQLIPRNSNSENESGPNKKREAINVRSAARSSGPGLGSASAPLSSGSARSGSIDGNNNSDSSCSSNLQ